MGVEAQWPFTFELIVAKIAETAGLEIDDVDQADEVHAIGVKAVPAGALGAAAVALAIELLFRVEEIMLAGNVMHVELALRDDPVGVIKLRFERQVADVTGMDHESGFLRQRDDLVHGLLKRAERIGIGRLVEAHMAVADLQERQALNVLRLRLRLAHDAQRVRHAAGNGPKHAGADPGHAFEDFTSVYAIVAVEIAHFILP